MADKVMIHVESLRKDYGSGRYAVDGISFDVRAGEVLGFLGPNGAGKTTTMKILTSFLAPTSGPRRGRRARRLRGQPRGPRPHRLPARGHAALPRHDGARVPRVRLRRARRARRRARSGAAARVVEQCGIGDRLGALIGELSKGFRQRVGPGAGDRPRARGAHPRRADLGPRPQPDRRDPRRHQADRPGEDGHLLDAHPRRGAGHLLARHHHQRRQAGRRRHARTIWRASRRAPSRSSSRSAAAAATTPIRWRCCATSTASRTSRRSTPAAGASPIARARRSSASSPRPASTRAATSRASSPPRPAWTSCR